MEKLIVEESDIASLTARDVYKKLGSNPNGLTSEQAGELQKVYGKNKLKEAEKTPVWKVFLSHFTSMMANLLWVAGIIAISTGSVELGISIFMVNIINGLFSFIQENRASKATEALQGMLSDQTRVIRDGQEMLVSSEDLVVGDVMVIEEGDKISADARLVASSQLQVDQSTLTGESTPVSKIYEAVNPEGKTNAELKNMIFSGTSVSEGNGRAVVTRIGMDTEFGKIADLTQNMEEKQSPLQVELDHLTKQIAIIAVSLGVIFFLLAVFFVKEPAGEAFIFAIGMIVAFIPEGLSPSVTLSLALAVQRMTKRNALVKKLSSVETLGSTTVICTDKTGTLTQNEMTVVDVWTPSQSYQVTGTGYSPEGQVQLRGEAVYASQDDDLAVVLRGASLCSNARLIEPETAGDRYTVLGDPTEACLGVVAQKAGIDLTKQSQLYPRIHELPFESRRKRMTTIHQLPHSVNGTNRIAFVKGAPKEIVDLSTLVQINGQTQKITKAMQDEIIQANDNYANGGYRVLAVAYRYLNPGESTDLPQALSEYTTENIEKDLTFAGLVVMQDPPRQEVKDAVRECHRAGIRIIMITGDYGLTAKSIAKNIGIVTSDEPRVVSGVELSQMSDQTLKEYLKDDIIFARVAPEQKLQVVTALQEMGEVVAVTGDGVNDSPALKKADIGVAMGITGTDVAKESADMILTDDNFASIISAIEEGRAVYSNIRKFLTYILTSNVAEAVPSIIWLLSRGTVPLPLTVMQILTIDLGTDLLPALGLGAEKPQKGQMDQPPRSKSDHIMNKDVLWRSFGWYGLWEGLFSMIGYFVVNVQNGWPNVPLAMEGTDIYVKATTMTLAGVVFAQVGAVYNCRTDQDSLFKVGLFSNKLVNRGVVFEIILIACLMYIPFLQNIFNTGPIDLVDWLYLLLIPVMMIFVDEVRKYFLRRKAN